MKILSFFVTLAVVASFTTGCPKHPVPNPDSTLEIFYNDNIDNALSISDITIEGRQISIDVKANRGWAMTPLVAETDWVTVSPTSAAGDYTTPVQITVKPNDGAARSADLVFKSEDGTVTRTVKLAQAAKPAPEVVSIDFGKSFLAYYFSGKGVYIFEFFANDELDAPVLSIEFTSDLFENAVEAIPADGTYTFSDTRQKFTFVDAEYNETGKTDDDIEVIGGEFTISRTSSVYTVRVDFELENGKLLKATYTGEAWQMPLPDEDVALDFNEMEYAEAGAHQPFGGNMWAVLLVGESYQGMDIMVALTVNADPGLTELPTGNFPMAAEARKGVSGTAEPLSYYASDDDTDWDMLPGCIYMLEDWGGSYAVPGKGFVNITKTDQDYAIEFSFEGPNGKTVSGSYEGAVYTIGDEYMRMPAKASGMRLQTRRPSVQTTRPGHLLRDK